MNNKIFVLVATVVAAVGFIFFKTQSGPKSSTAQPLKSTSANFVRSHSPSYGNALGRVTVVEWFDPECESCRMIHPILKKIILDYRDRVRFVLRYMPYHGNSLFAAAALEEARELGKYDEALDLLFETQPQWGDHHQPRPELIPEYMGKLGIPKSKLERSYLLEKHEAKIRIDEADGKNAGVRGTPAFFVNGVMIAELGDEALRSAIEDALKISAEQ